VVEEEKPAYGVEEVRCCRVLKAIIAREQYPESPEK